MVEFFIKPHQWPGDGGLTNPRTRAGAERIMNLIGAAVDAHATSAATDGAGSSAAGADAPI